MSFQQKFSDKEEILRKSKVHIQFSMFSMKCHGSRKKDIYSGN